MSDHSELNRLAEAATPGPWAYDGSYVCPARTEDGTTYVELWRSIADCHQPENTKFIAAANPAAVLALIAENERLKTDLREQKVAKLGLSWAIGEIMGERDQLRIEVEALRKDAERFRFIEQDESSGMSKIYGDDWLEVVDQLIGMGDKS